MTWNRHRGKRSRSLPKFLPRPGLFRLLGALVTGERLTLDPRGRLVLTAAGDPARGLLLESADLDELERRGWVTLTGDAAAVVTAEGRKWFAIWYEHEHPGRRLVRVNVRGDAHTR